MLTTLQYDYSCQSYSVEKRDSTCVHYCSYEGLLDYNNVYHVKHLNGNLFAPVKYHLENIITEYVKGSNPLNI